MSVSNSLRCRGASAPVSPSLAIAARFALNHSQRLSRLVLVDSLGLARFHPAPKPAITMIAFLMRPTERTVHALYAAVLVQSRRAPRRVGHALGAIRRLQPRTRPWAGLQGRWPLLREVGLPQIPPDDLARIVVPTVLNWPSRPRESAEIAEIATDGPLTSSRTARTILHATSRVRFWTHFVSRSVWRGVRGSLRTGGRCESSRSRRRIDGCAQRGSHSCNAARPEETANHRHAPTCGPSAA